MKKLLYLVLVVLLVPIVLSQVFSNFQDYKPFWSNCTVSNNTFNPGGNPFCFNFSDNVVISGGAQLSIPHEAMTATNEEWFLNITLNQVFFAVTNITLDFPNNNDPSQTCGIEFWTNDILRFNWTAPLTTKTCTAPSDLNLNTQGNFTDLQGFDLIEIKLCSSFRDNCGDNQMAFDEISFLVSNTTNTIPNFNLTVPNRIACINESGQSVIFNISVNASDAENDTIFYAVGSGFQNQSISVDFNRFVSSSPISFNQECSNPQSIFCNAVPKFNFLSNVFFPSNETCRVNEGINFNPDFFNLFLFPSLDNKDRYMLELQNFCVGLDKTFYYRTDANLRDFNFFGSFFGLNPTEELNISFKGQNLKNIYLFKVNRINNRFLINNINGSNSVLIVNETDSLLRRTQDFGFSLSTFDIGENVTIRIEFKNQTIVYDTIKILDNDDLMLYISFAINGSTVLLADSFRYGGVISRPNFTTTRPTFFELTEFGLTTTTVFVTDTFHLSTDFVSDSVNLNVVQCSGFVTPVNVFSEAKFTTAFNLLRGSIFNVCTTLDSSFFVLFTGGDSRFGFCFMLNFLYLLITGFISLGFALVIRLIDLRWSFPSFAVIYSLFAMVGTLILNFSSVTLFFYAILGVLGLAVWVRVIIFSDPIGGIEGSGE